MKNIKRKLKIGLVIAELIIITVAVVFVYVKAFISIADINNEIEALEIRYDELTSKNEMKQEYDNELKYIDYELTRLEEVLPPDIIQERVILSLRRIEKASGSKITLIKFSPVQKAEKAVIPQKTENKDQSQINEIESSENESSDAVKENPKADFKDGEQILMNVNVSFRTPYENLKNMLKEISAEKNRVIINNINILRDSNNSKNLSGSIDLTFFAQKDSKRSFDEWELKLDKGVLDLFLPFDGYAPSDDVLLPEIENKYKSAENNGDFYLLVNPYNNLKPAVLIGKYDEVYSEIFYDGNETIDINFYLEEKNNQLFFRTRTKRMPYPDEENSVLFYPKKDNIVMDIISAPVTDANDKVKVRLNVYNNTERNLLIYTDDISERVSIIAKEGYISTAETK